MKTIGRVYLISCAMLLSACAVEVSEEEFAEEAAELEGEAFVAGEADGEAVGTSTEALAAARYVQPHNDGACHTFDYLRAISNVYCNNLGCAEAYDRNYTHGCSGWWGNGARYVWFSCRGC